MEKSLSASEENFKAAIAEQNRIVLEDFICIFTELT